MTYTENLQRLIASLKANEKAYFSKLKSAFTKNDSLILQLFKEIPKERKSEEEIINELFKGKRSLYNYKRNILFNEILDALSYAHQKSNSTVWNVQRDLGHVRVLKEKNMHMEAKKAAYALKKKVEKNEFFGYQMELTQLLLELEMITNMDDTFDVFELSNALRRENIKTAQKVINNEEYYILTNVVYKKLTEFNVNKRGKHALEAAFQDTLLSSPDQALSNTAKVCYYFLKYTEALYIHRDFDLAFELADKAIYHSQQVDRISPRTKSTNLSNFIHLAFHLNEIDRIPPKLDQLKKVMLESEDVNVLLIFIYHNLEFYKAKGEYVELREFLKDIDAKYRSSFESLPDSADKIDLIVELISCYIILGDFQKAYYYLNYCDGMFNKDTLVAYKLFAKIGKFMCAYELQDFDLLESEFRAVMYLDAKKVELNIYDQLAIDCLKKIYKSRNERELANAFRYFVEHYNAEVKMPQKVSHVVKNCYFDLWVISKLDGTQLVDVYQHKIYPQEVKQA